MNVEQMLGAPTIYGVRLQSMATEAIQGGGQAVTQKREGFNLGEVVSMASVVQSANSKHANDYIFIKYISKVTTYKSSVRFQSIDRICKRHFPSSESTHQSFIKLVRDNVALDDSIGAAYLSIYSSGIDAYYFSGIEELQTTAQLSEHTLAFTMDDEDLINQGLPQMIARNPAGKTVLKRRNSAGVQAFDLNGNLLRSRDDMDTKI